jgi:aspartate/methionine/tyrosine aminotransferase
LTADGFGEQRTTHSTAPEKEASSLGLVAGAAASKQAWRGRYPPNEIISLINVSRHHNLAESTAQDLTLGDLLDLVPDEKGLRSLELSYGTSLGASELRRTIAQERDIPVDWVLTTQGTALGLHLIASELTQPGDHVVLVTPCFPPTRDVFVGCGVHVDEVKLRFSERYRLNASQVAQMLRSSTRLVGITTPQNPSGVRIPETVIDDLIEAIRTRAPEAWLFVDETYRDATYGLDPTPGSAAQRGVPVVTGGSVSKAHGAPGLRVGWLTVPDAELRTRLSVAKFNTVISGSVVDEFLATALLRRADLVLAPRRQLLAQGVEMVAQWQKHEDHRLEWVRPDAGALCCCRLREDAFDNGSVIRFWSALPTHDLQLAAGTWFGDEARVFRLGFGFLPIERLSAALAVVSRAMDRASGASPRTVRGS